MTFSSRIGLSIKVWAEPELSSLLFSSFPLEEDLRKTFDDFVMAGICCRISNAFFSKPSSVNFSCFFFRRTVIRQFNYSQTWDNDHLRITTTCLQRSPFGGPIVTFYNTKLPLNNDHLSTTATNLGPRGWSLFTGLTVFIWHIWHIS